VQSRDVYQYGIWNITDSGSIYFVLVDMADDDRPEEPGCVRMEVPIGGFLFTPRKGDSTKCDIDYVGEVNLKGNIPDWVTK